MLAVKKLCKAFGPLIAVREVSFQADQGEVLGFLGPNGAGKTTTMRMITGFLPPTSGTAVINGHDICAAPRAAKKQIGYLPENAPVYGDMTVWNYLAFIAEIRGFTGLPRNKKVDETVEICRLNKVKHQAISTLSKGYRQRVCLAQALLHDPPVLIMDEPTDGLDPNQKHLVRTMIREMAARKTIVISTHILEEVDAVCTRAIIICNGSIIANGSPAELKAKSRLHGAVEATFRNLNQDILGKIKQLSSAAETTTVGNTVTIMPRNAAMLFQEMTDLTRANPGWPIMGLRTLEGKLDDVFRELTGGR
ncbi:MAG: ATP-binding cassette domain-containing protein [Kiritimatiellia bacterium]|nr:ATP-binding cassette domain-containing protein [Kiritimatiellia bacterium]